MAALDSKVWQRQGHGSPACCCPEPLGEMRGKLCLLGWIRRLCLSLDMTGSTEKAVTCEFLLTL